MWICTATGSSAAMAAAGGSPMDVRAKRCVRSATLHLSLCVRNGDTLTFFLSLQYMVRENMREYGQESIKAAGSGIIGSRCSDTILYSAVIQ